MPAALSVKVVGTRELQAKWLRLGNALRADFLSAAVTSGANICRDAASVAAPYRTGTLKRSLHTEVGESTALRAVVLVGTDLEYAQAIEFGSGLYGPKKAKYIIRPKNKKALFWKGARHPVAFVMHPGVRPRPFLLPAFQATKSAVRAEIGGALRSLLRGYAKKGGA
ncbi:MAG: HK97 gp10 family phage protein [Chloroflexota bacterium]